ncbi:DNA polymerase III subunit alpha [Candidatus Cytomitobacter primus]|uniref:DNA polymerase III subunit alpha n=1 Tax=Candidatus Cytomitobacter primus TaxID=2066024 RepID=A0A5C0UH64_9PROT|nr:DNA polymerase III subunit alpha [Candidatus Cytomitobacter primus]QEK38384.1 DNA polymerase III subunit alpha [Candidatus Cytomitobacter primus]
MPSYIPLGIRTSYSLLQSSIRISELKNQDQFKEFGIVDQHNMFGTMDYNENLANSGVKPITGCELNLNGKYQILVYCKNQIGYKNLCKIISNSYRDKEPSVYWDDFQNADGLMAIAIPGQICDQDQIQECVKNMEKYFYGNWAVGIKNRDTDEYDACYMSSICSTPIVAIPDIRCMKKEQNQAYHALTCIKNGKYFDEDFNQELHLPSSEEMEELYSDWPTPLENTFLFAKKCSFLLKKKKPELPNFSPIPEGMTEQEYLHHKAFEGLATKVNLEKSSNKQNSKNHINDLETYKKRLEFELGVINKMGFDGYFLIVADFINWAKENGVPVGPGRGSGAGSLVAYCIGITAIDPLNFGLVFERFLNPGRVSMPDFDIDFCPKGRGKVVNYIIDKYGKDNVAHIITFGSLQSKGVLRDVGRILQVPYPVVDRYSKAIPVIQGTNLSLNKFMENNDDLDQEMQQNDGVKKMFELSLKIEGLHRHASIHAAGIVIGKEPLYNYLPLYREHNLTVTQFSLNHIEDAGLVKFDLLGLTALTIISDTEKLVKNNHPDFDINNIPIDDDHTLNIFRNGHTVGIFQFESKGMTEAVVGLKPEVFEDLIAVISLYRPGPMENIPTFIKRKHGVLPINYLFPEMEATLKSTYGVLVYQEQVLEIARNMAGYSMQEADLMRRAIGKKKPEEMKKLKSEFVSRICSQMKSNEEKATELFDQIESFARYAFVKAHATPYALIGYQSAYLKANHPIQFIVSSMILEKNNTEKLAEFIYEGKRMKINTLLPDINKSHEIFTIEGKEIRFGLSAIKNVSINCIKNIIANKPFHNIDDFFKRTSISKKSLENLIKSGAFDSLEKNRALVWEKRNKDYQSPALLFETNEQAEEWDEETKSQYEYEALGIYITGHPLSKLDTRKMNIEWISQRESKEEHITGIGKLEKVISKKSPNGDAYSICIASDPFGIWRFISREKQDSLSKFVNQKICITGEDKAKFIISNTVQSFEQFLLTIEQIIFTIDNKANLLSLYKTIQDDLTQSKGTKVMLHFSQENPIIVGKINLSEDVLNKISEFNWKI